MSFRALRESNLVMHRYGCTCTTGHTPTLVHTCNRACLLRTHGAYSVTAMTRIPALDIHNRVAHLAVVAQGAALLEASVPLACEPDDLRGARPDRSDAQRV